MKTCNGYVIFAVYLTRSGITSGTNVCEGRSYQAGITGGVILGLAPGLYNKEKVSGAPICFSLGLLTVEPT